MSVNVLNHSIVNIMGRGQVAETSVNHSQALKCFNLTHRDFQPHIKSLPLFFLTQGHSEEVWLSQPLRLPRPGLSFIWLTWA